MRRQILVAGLAACIAGCIGDDGRRGGGGGGGGGGATTMLEGIYELSAWTRNEAGCTAEGPSVLETETRQFILIRQSSFFGQTGIELVLCADLLECRDAAMDQSFQVSELGALDQGDDTTGWTGGRIVAGGSGGTCSGAVTKTTLRADGAMQIRVESKITRTGDFPPDSDGFCTTESAEAAASLQTCEIYDVIGGVLAEALP